MSRTIRVDLGGRAYDIRIGRGVKTELTVPAGRRIAALIVSDTNVDPLYGPPWEARLRERGFDVVRAAVPAGESSKDLAVVADLCGRAADAGVDRSGMVVALGGGVVGDLGGFVAAVFLRGIRLVQAPTSLLAMVDSSVGGKTAVNLRQGKNLVGAFHQPAEVVADLDALRTLPRREFVSGLAEVVKHGVIRDRGFFERLEQRAADVTGRDPELLEELVARNCEIKAAVVATDERESDVRAILNFGHTLGHAFESVAGYGALLHGEAVSLGMSFAGRLSVRERGFGAADCERMDRLLRAMGLPVRPREAGIDLSWGDLRRAMAADKKGRDRLPRFVLIDDLGAAAHGCTVSEPLLAGTFAAWAAAR
jgi:3-dehydroquinate synthase